jgi:predicted DCC family thiol-disulfide oxidoreductase YuxK
MTASYNNLILFDGVCNFCTSSVQFVIRHDREEKFKFLVIQSDLGREVCRASGLDPDDVQSFALITSGRTLTQSDAALEIAIQFGGLWRMFGVFKLVPKGLRDRLYSLIANRRYRWFGRRDSCMTPSENLRSRFLT